MRIAPLAIIFLIFGCLSNDKEGTTPGPVGTWEATFLRTVHETDTTFSFNVKIRVEIKANDSCEFTQSINDAYASGFTGTWISIPDSLVFFPTTCYKGLSGVKTVNTCAEDFPDGRIGLPYSISTLYFDLDSTRMSFTRIN